VLWHSITISSPSTDVLDRFGYLVQRAEQAIQPVLALAYGVEERGGGFAVSEQGDDLAFAPDATRVLDVVYRRIHQRVFEFASLRGWVRVHGAVVDAGGRRMLLVGPSGAGKSTLVLRLLFDGAAAQGDESALVRNGRVLAVPRPFHLKPGVDAVVPEVAPILGALPCLEGEVPVRAFDPTSAGLPWRIDEAPLDDVVVLDPAHGQPSVLEPASAAGSMHEIVEQVFPNQETRGAVIREVAAGLRTARCWRLRLGDVNEAASLLVTAGEADFSIPG
jgi:hypothetical protein